MFPSNNFSSVIEHLQTKSLFCSADRTHGSIRRICIASLRCVNFGFFSLAAVLTADHKWCKVFILTLCAVSGILIAQYTSYLRMLSDIVPIYSFLCQLWRGAARWVIAFIKWTAVENEHWPDNSSTFSTKHNCCFFMTHDMEKFFKSFLSCYITGVLCFDSPFRLFGIKSHHHQAFVEIKVLSLNYFIVCVVFNMLKSYCFRLGLIIASFRKWI